MVLTSALKAPYPGKPGSDAELGQLVTLRTMEVGGHVGFLRPHDLNVK